LVIVPILTVLVPTEPEYVKLIGRLVKIPALPIVKTVVLFPVSVILPPELNVTELRKLEKLIVGDVSVYVLNAKFPPLPIDNVTPLKLTLEPNVVGPVNVIVVLLEPIVELAVIVLVPETVKDPVKDHVVLEPIVTFPAIVKLLDPVNKTVAPVVFNVAQVADEMVTVGEPELASKNTFVLDATTPALPAPPDEDAQLVEVVVSQVPEPPTQYALASVVGAVI
jgi:hypothetical protein